MIGRLTTRERDVIRRVGVGASNKEVARSGRSRRDPRSFIVMLLIGAGACSGASNSTGVSPTGVSPTASSQEAFVSSHYGYSITSTDWKGTQANIAWDGTGAPGDTDPSVDTLVGAKGQIAWAYGEPTTDTLEKFTATLRKVDATVHPCPVKPETTDTISVGGERAILDDEHCPPGNGAYVILAYVVHSGHGYVFFTFSTLGDTFTRHWFTSLLKDVSFPSQDDATS